MESQNHYYGHSAAFARYLGLSRPRHVTGLVQHGWTAVSPLDTHFRDFPRVGAGRRGRRLLVWSHRSRAWDPATAPRASRPVGAPFLYLHAALVAEGRAAAVPSGGGGTVVLPVHGIATQRLLGDHAAVAREWARTEGPATVCLYHVEADDPRVVAAYRDAGHRLVTLGTRTDGAFLTRLHGLLAGADRVVSNRLSTPVVYAAALGVPTAVHGDAMALEGEDPVARDRTRRLWPELHDPDVDAAVRGEVARAEVGEVLPAAELRALLGWDRPRVGPWAEHWVGAPASRAVTTLRRRRAPGEVGAGSATGPVGAVASAAPPAPDARTGTAPVTTAAAPTTPAAPPGAGPSGLAFLRAAAGYLPHRLAPVVPTAAPIPVR